MTRDGNTVATWNDSLNLTGLSIQSNGGIEVRNSKFFGNRTGIDINTGNGNYIHNNIVDNNRTGIILRRDCLNNLITQNDITNNWTQGVVWLGGVVAGDGAGTVISGNNISANWFSQIENRDATSGTVKNFSGNWLGTSIPTTDPTDEAAAPGYADQIPVIFGGTAVAPDPSLIPTIRGTGLAFLDFSPYLASGVDTSPDIGFQGDFSHLIATTVGGQSGSIGRIQEAVDLLAEGSLMGTARTIEVLGGTYDESSNLNKSLTLNLNDNLTVGSLDSVASATIQLQAFTLTVGDNTTTNTLAGGLAGAGNLIKQGSDTLILAGTNTFVGTTTINLGTLLVNGTTSSNMIVNTGGILGGNGTVAGTVTVASGGTLAPGNSPGIINTGNLTLAAGSTFAAEVNGSIPGSEADEVVVTGTVDITGATLATSGTIASFPGQVITLIDNLGADAITGTFAGLAEGDTVAINGTTFTISYVGGNGNDVTLSEAEAAFSIDDVTINEAAGTLDFTVTLDKPLTIDVIVNVSFTGGTATGGATDYTSTTQQVTFLANETSHTVSVPINDDNVVEATEDFFASLSTSTDLGGRVVDFSDTGTGTITDNDSATVSITPIANGAETDTPTNGTFRVILSAPSSTDTVVTYSVGGTATPGSDFTSLTGSVTIPAGDLFADITVDVLNDSAAEDTETVIVTLTDFTSADAEITLDPTPANLTATANITDDDDLVITSGATASTPENTPASSVIIDVNTNETPGHTVSYQLSGPEAALFAISVTGEVSFLASPDYENPLDQGADNIYNVTVTATADFVPEKVATQDLTITVTAENDHAPVITSVITSATVPENTPNSAVLLDIDATDADVPAQALTYTLTGPDAAVFAINSTTGEITFVDSPDYENPFDQGADNVYNVTVNVTDSGSPTQTTPQDLTVTVTALNDNAPVISSSSTAAIAENFPTASVVLDVNATDVDIPAQTLTYSLSGPDAAVFAIDPGTGEITFLMSPDYEVPTDQGADNVYHVTVNVADSGVPTLLTTQDLTFTVTPLNDNFPVITSVVTTAAVPENTSAVTVVLDINATDADVPAQALTFTLTGPDAAIFAINTTTGEITFVASPDYENPLDQGADNIYNVTVNVTDSGTPTQTTPQDLTVTVTPLNDNAPVITSVETTASVPENTPNSAVILNIDASDTDVPVQSLTYSLTGPDASVFAINSSTGEITFLASPDYDNPLDQGTDNVYNVTVNVTDSGAPPLTTTQDLTITVTPLNDSAPEISSSAAASVDENTSAAIVVLDVNATDSDVPAQALTYSLSGIDASLFSIDRATGEIRFLSSPDFENPLDDGVNNVYNVTVTVTDSGPPAAATPQDLTIIVTAVNDNTPVITSPATASVAENTPISTVVLNVDASDSDIPPHTLSYSLSGPDAAMFTINGATGEITFLTSPDFEAPGDLGGDNVYNVTVTVNDNGVPTTATTQDLTITVTPVNDHGPVFVDASPTFAIPENSTVGTVVGGVMAMDADSPTQSLTYSIISGNESGAFTIDPATGEITVADSTPLNFEVTPQFTLVVRVTDNGSPTPSTADATVVIDLTSVQEDPTITILNSEGTYHLKSSPGFVAPDATFTYGDLANPNFNGAVLTVSIVAGRSRKDKLSILSKGDASGQISVKGSKVFFGGKQVGTFEGGKGGKPNLVVTLNDKATVSAVDNLMRRINFYAKDGVGTTRTVQLQITNINGVDSNVATRDIDVVQ